MQLNSVNSYPILFNPVYILFLSCFILFNHVESTNRRVCNVHPVTRTLLVPILHDVESGGDHSCFQHWHVDPLYSIACVRIASVTASNLNFAAIALNICTNVSL